LQTLKGLALQDIITEVHLYLLRLKISQELRMALLDKLAEAEYRLASGTSEKLNLGAMVGAFQIAKEQMAAEMK
jgi:replication factor C subunit 3/5